MGSACIFPPFILSNPFLDSFTPYSLNATRCDNRRCSASALEFMPGATANADGSAEVCDCHHVHYVHMLCLSSLWGPLLYKMMCIIEIPCAKECSLIVPPPLLYEFKVWIL